MLFACIFLIAGAALAPKVSAQDVPNQRQVRAYIPPDQVVSFLPSTPFNRFVEFVDPIFLRVTGKQIVDPEGRANAIGVSIAGMQFLDAFELVLQFNGLWYQETEQFFIVGPAPTEGVAAIAGAAATGTEPNAPATIDTREIQINAILFELDHNMARDTGLNWSTFLGDSQGQQSGGSGGSTGGGSVGGGQVGGGEGTQTRPRFFLRTDDLFDSIDDLMGDMTWTVRDTSWSVGGGEHAECKVVRVRVGWTQTHPRDEVVLVTMVPGK